jgi:hypothetical protein
MARRRLTGHTLDEVRPLDRPGPLRKGVLDALRELIIARTLLPGQHLVESELHRGSPTCRGSAGSAPAYTSWTCGFGGSSAPWPAPEEGTRGTSTSSSSMPWPGTTALRPVH